MDSHTLIQALIYLGSAALIVPIAVRLGLGSVLGYLIAGCIIGPWGLRLVTDAEIYSALCRDWRGTDAVYYRPRTRSTKAVEAACSSVWWWRIADGDLRRACWGCSVCYLGCAGRSRN
ncbi:glutathione-regulated potassium-efflux system protein KefC [Escherichia coli]|uniref:Glutathione-regulated potassium-efflux system protein KefC n=1 Tax=Escherichia coli TaxID=562 RepID=A0A376VNL4_ECOLX|nr:glutathione-regulated potassium-efflux system protein KefC [Escherichia coli]